MAALRAFQSATRTATRTRPVAIRAPRCSPLVLAKPPSVSTVAASRSPAVFRQSGRSLVCFSAATDAAKAGSKFQVTGSEGRPDLSKVFQKGEKIKVVVTGVSATGTPWVSTKKIEETPGQMLKDKATVFANAEKVAEKLTKEGLERQAKRKAYIEKLKVGDVIQGRVLRIVPGSKVVFIPEEGIILSAGFRDVVPPFTLRYKRTYEFRVKDKLPSGYPCFEAYGNQRYGIGFSDRIVAREAEKKANADASKGQQQGSKPAAKSAPAKAKTDGAPKSEPKGAKEAKAKTEAKTEANPAAPAAAPATTPAASTATA